MKALSISLAVLAFVGLAAIVTKPDDVQCMKQLRGQLATGSSALDQLAGALAVNRYTVTIEDRIFFKQIYAVDGSCIGTAAFGRVWGNE